MKSDDILDICKISNRKVSATPSTSSHAIGKKSASLEECAPGDSYLDMEKPLHEDNELEESFRILVLESST